MKTTQQLIELQRSITQGEWKANLATGSFRAIGSFSDGMIAKASLIVTKANSNKWQPDTATTDANARAIALVPELLVEVIRLREANEAMTRKLDIAYNGLTTVKKITDGSQPKDFPSVPTVAAYVLGELAQ